MLKLRALGLPLLSGLLGLSSLGCDTAELEAQAAKTAQLEAEISELEAARKAAASALEAANTKAEACETKETELSAKVTDLESSKGALEGELEAKKLALEALEKLQDALSKSLVAEIETGEISVTQRDGFLVIDVADKVLFATGEAQLSERGQEVITKLADTLKALPRKSVFQVGGHTDNQAIKSEEVLANFPTNWELSAARATNVVRFLEETCKIPGERLVAAGFSQFRPVASNKKAKKRAKNRRIEIALLPPRD